MTDSALFAFIVPSPKREDLVRDGRYAMHSFPAEDNDDAFYITGRTEPVADDKIRTLVAAQFAQEREMTEPPNELAEWMLFSFDIERCLLTRTAGHGDTAPQHSMWQK